MRTTNRAGLVTLFLLLGLEATAFAADPYDDAFARASEHERRGDPAAAAATLEAVLPLYPQDYDLPLAIAWAHFRAGRYVDSERSYRLALWRSPLAIDAHVGLAATLERLGRCREASAEYEGVLRADPERAAAREGLSRCAPKPSWSGVADLSLTGHAYPDHAFRTYAASAAASLDVAHRSGFVLGAAYRYSHFFTSATSGVPEWGQHEIHARSGYSGPLFGIVAQYALVDDESGTQGLSHHVGLSARWSPYGDIVVNGSMSSYSDMNLFRLEPSWKIPIAGGFSVQPGGALQRTSTETLGSGFLTLMLEGRIGSLFLGGKYGEEVRPVHLSLGLVDNAAERIEYGLWAGGTLNVGQGFGIHLSYSLDRLKATTGESNGHYLALGVSKSF